MYVCVFMHVSVRVCACMHACMRLFVCMNIIVCMYTRMCVGAMRVCAYMYVCDLACMDVFMHICELAYCITYMYTHGCIYFAFMYVCLRGRAVAQLCNMCAYVYLSICMSGRLPVVCRLVYICKKNCYTLDNHDYFLRNTYLSGKNVVAIFSVWSRGHFQHKMYKNMNITRKN